MNDNIKGATLYQSMGEIILYQPDDTIRLEVMIEYETVWLTQAQMGLLFGRDRTVINRHIRNIFSEGELQEKEVCANFAQTSQHGAIIDKTQTKNILSYNLDVIISVGYRVKSHRGIQFRRWASCVLKEYLLRGFAIHQRFERIEQRVAESEKNIFLVKSSLIRSEDHLRNEISELKQYIESILADYNDINIRFLFE